MNVSVVILAAGMGKRMKSDTPKVLHEALGKPMILHTLDAVRKLKPAQTIVVVGNGAEAVRKRIDDGSLSFVLQKELLGTGHALAMAGRRLAKGTVLVLNGDCPLITAQTLKRLLARHRKAGNMLSFLSFTDESMSGYGRIIRDEKGRVTGIVEDKHATPGQKENFRELNGGVYLLETGALDFLRRIKKNRSSGEYYLTDIVGLLSDSGGKLDAYGCPPEEIRGVNNREELYEVSDILRRRTIAKWMEKGVTFLDPRSSTVHSSVSIGRDTIIYPNTCLEGDTVTGKGCVIYTGARMCDSRLGDGVIVKDHTLIESSRIKNGAVIGPFAHLRPGSVIGRNAKIGNFVEVKKSKIGDGTKASHLSYLGDADIGKNVNIGAGTITCNYDGKHKHRTKIGPDVFIGSDTQIVAPVAIGRGAYVAAGATITKNVPPGSLAISRARQKNLHDWAAKKAGAMKDKSPEGRKTGRAKARKRKS